MFSDDDIFESVTREFARCMGSEQTLMLNTKRRFTDQDGSADETYGGLVHNADISPIFEFGTSWSKKRNAGRDWLREYQAAARQAKALEWKNHLETRETKWGNVLKPLASLPQDGVHKIPVPRGHDSVTYGKKIRNNINGFKCLRKMRFSVRAKVAVVIVKRIGDWAEYYSQC